jgi:exopolyphosphatase/guanosine-5'-triphosphate,3'-diphosphate pyrophosphatase
VTAAPGAPTRVAAVDCGTNSIRLLIAEQDAHGSLVDLDRRLEIVRLGQGVDATGEFHPDALDRTFAAADRYAELVTAAGVPRDAVHFVATSAARDARNRLDFFAGIQERLGVVPDVISGQREAELSFVGALSRSRPAAGPVLVMDVGGGSTELIVGSIDGVIRQAVSLDVGSVRLTERFLRVSPPAAADLDRAGSHVDGLIAESGLDLAAIATWIGVAGTITTLAAVHLGLEHYDRDRVHGSVISSDALALLLTRLASASVDEIRALAGMHPQRADVITAGALIAARVAAATPVTELGVSESDILDGIALDLLRRRTA